MNPSRFWVFPWRRPFPFARDKPGTFPTGHNAPVKGAREFDRGNRIAFQVPTHDFVVGDVTREEQLPRSSQDLLLTEEPFVSVNALRYPQQFTQFAENSMKLLRNV